MTIEPMMFVQVRIMMIMMIRMMIMTQGLAGGISGIATDQMILYKICRGKLIIDAILQFFNTTDLIKCFRGQIWRERNILL